MSSLTAPQCYHLYQQAAQRTGLHAPLLAALAQVHTQPRWADGTTGLGITPAQQIALDQVNTLAGQVNIAADTLRTLMQRCIQQGWSAAEFWHSEQGRYSDRWVQQVAQGFTPHPQETRAAQLERCEAAALQTAYRQAIAATWQGQGRYPPPPSQSFVDAALRSHLRQLAQHYLGLQPQQTALLELVRIWQGWDRRDQAIAYLAQELALPLDAALLFFLRQILSDYAGYPHQREAALSLVRLWHQFDSRETTLWHLERQQFPVEQVLDRALLAFLQRLPRFYPFSAAQRHALVEGFRDWHQFATVPDALLALGVDPAVFTSTVLHPAALAHATQQVDRALLDFLRQIPALYTPRQRESALQLGQSWYATPSRIATVQALIDDLKRSETAPRETFAAVPPPVPPPPPDRPSQWTPETLQLHTPICAGGSITWAEATSGGVFLPPNPWMVESIAAMAAAVQSVRDRLGRPLTILRWYCPIDHDPLVQIIATPYFAIGSAILFYCTPLTGRQLYWFLDPWWAGGLGYHRRYPHLCYLDGRSDRARLWSE